jgi:predicted RNase H-like nuclease (RuvC/YqgF family)
MSDTDPYEREAAKAAIKVLQRELAEARELLIKCLSVMPVGYVPTHTVENLPEMIGDLAKALADETTECEQLERELAEARKQRDTLAEALEMVATHKYADGQCDNGYSPQYVAKQTLSAVKGGSND